MQPKSSRKDRVMLGDLVLAEVVLTGPGGATTSDVHEKVAKSAQRDDVNMFRTSRILIGLRRRGLVDRSLTKRWCATDDGLDRVASWQDGEEEAAS